MSQVELQSLAWYDGLISGAGRGQCVESTAPNWKYHLGAWRPLFRSEFKRLWRHSRLRYDINSRSVLSADNPITQMFPTCHVTRYVTKISTSRSTISNWAAREPRLYMYFLRPLLPRIVNLSRLENPSVFPYSLILYGIHENDINLSYYNSNNVDNVLCFVSGQFQRSYDFIFLFVYYSPSTQKFCTTNKTENVL